MIDSSSMFYIKGANELIWHTSFSCQAQAGHGHTHVSFSFVICWVALNKSSNSGLNWKRHTPSQAMAQALHGHWTNGLVKLEFELDILHSSLSSKNSLIVGLVQLICMPNCISYRHSEMALDNILHKQQVIYSKMRN